MKLGIIGLPNSGKTTVFNALTGSDIETGAVSSGRLTTNMAVVQVPDPRVEKLSDMYKPKKTTYATVTYVDVGGLDKGVGKSGLPGELRNAIAPVDGFVHVIRQFEDDGVPHPHTSLDPKRDLEALDSEFLLTDLITVESRLERLQEELKKKGKKATGRSVEEEIALLERIKAHLETESPLRNMDLDEEEKKSLRGFGLFTMKPVVVVINTNEPLEDTSGILTYDHQNATVLALAGQIEAEIAQLGDDDKAIFLEEYGIAEPGANRIIRASYNLMSIQTFFTVGEDEVRAWGVRIGAKAPEAAGVIHSDLQRGFIRAETVAYDDLVGLGSMTNAKSEGKVRLEGKEYTVQDGDILNIRFNA